NLTERVKEFLDHGIYVFGGMIVGFDSDGPDIFDIQYEFAMNTPIPIFTMGALVAPESTRLYDRIKNEGRLREEGEEIQGNPWNTNIVPRQMTGKQMADGIRWLCNNLYSTAAFTERVSSFVKSFKLRREIHVSSQPDFSSLARTVHGDLLKLIGK